ncbi:MAG TPA: hypothetical protein VFV03_01470 [Solirubrobacteraceae bacterium]|nr:hypothetical protein [Solirubrobacteraceae bacterium]
MLGEVSAGEAAEVRLSVHKDQSMLDCNKRLTLPLLDWLERRPWDVTDLPLAVHDVPTMISLQERALLYLLARDRYEGFGGIVDAGCFLGGSTLALAQGLLDRNSPVRDRVIHTFDLFRLDEGSYQPYASILGGLQPGDSLRPTFEALLEHRAAIVNMREGDVRDQEWTAGPVEILFIDLAKDWSINDHVARMFFPSLIPGQSVVLQQDYVHEWTPWLHILMEFLGDAFTYCGCVPFASAIFVPRRRIRAEELPDNLFADVSHEEKLILFDHSARRFDGEDRGVVECARAYLLYMIGQTAAAQAHLDEVEKNYQGARIDSILPNMRKACASASPT